MNSIHVIFPTGFTEAKVYVFDFIFNSVFKLDYTYEIKDTSFFSLKLPNSKVLDVRDVFFKNWDGSTDKKIMPTKVVYSDFENLESLKVPFLYGEPKMAQLQNGVLLEMDIIGSIFFVLSRFEEYVVNSKDKHDRILARNSILDEYSLTNRPVVDEYIYILYCQLSELDKSFKTDYLENGKVNVTCDVDWPFDPSIRFFKHCLRNSMVELVRNKSFKKSMSLLFRYFKNKIGLKVEDSFRTSIDWIMKVNEEKNNKVTFYFIPRPTSILDTPFLIESPEMMALLKSIVNRGHYIGVHPGYNCINDESVFKETLTIFAKLVKAPEFYQAKILSRMHFLRWDVAKTAVFLQKYGINYDSTMSYAEKAGFRCGTSHPHKMYDLIENKSLEIIQYPLIFMESSVISKRYEGLGHTELAFQRINKLKNNSIKYGGAFTMLWHNSNLETKQDRELYLRCI